MRSSVYLGMVACVTCSSLAWAVGPPVMVHTKDGNIYYGELVEKVDDHVTILLATGVPKRIELKDVDPSAVTRTLPPPPLEESRAPTDTVRTKNGSVYHGELIEKIPQDHVTLKLETGEIETIDWSDVDTSPPVRPRPALREAAPVVNVRTKNGSLYHGEIVERVVRDHVTIKLATDEIKTIDWEDIASTQPAPRIHAPPSLKEVELYFEADRASAILQRETDSGMYEDFCANPCQSIATFTTGTYRVAGRGLVASEPFRLRAGPDARVVASTGPRDRRTAGFLLVGLSVPALIAGVALFIAATSAPSYTYVSNYPYPAYPTVVDNTALDMMNVTVNLVGLGVLVAGIALIATSSTQVKVNGTPIARLGIDGLRF